MQWRLTLYDPHDIQSFDSPVKEDEEPGDDVEGRGVEEARLTTQLVGNQPCRDARHQVADLDQGDDPRPLIGGQVELGVGTLQTWHQRSRPCVAGTAHE